MIVQRLLAIQEERGYLRREDVEALLADLRREGVEVKLRHLHEIASFYPHFRTEADGPPPAAEIHVCRDMACHLAGAAGLRADLRGRLAGYGHRVHVGGASCLGQCDRAPAVRVNDRDCSLRDPGEIAALAGELAEGRRGRHEVPGPDVGPAPGWQIDIYRGREPDYRVLRAYVDDPDPIRVIGRRGGEEPRQGVLQKAWLLGLGGAGGRSWLKWEDVRNAPDPVKFVVCNGDESEPGTFKDREILLHFPHLTLEGMILAGLITGAERGFVYIRHEYERQIEAVRAAIARAYRLKVCGNNVLRTGKAFHLEVFVSPGGYICGEATALIEAMEDRRSEPRNRPPELTVKGLFDRPTLVNNVETFAWVPFVLDDGAERFVAGGAGGGKGLRLFSISGDVARPGVYEMPVGGTFGELIEKAGGTPRGLKAVATSGPSSGFTPARLDLSDRQRQSLRARKNRPSLQALADETGPIDLLRVPLDFDTARDLGVGLGPAIVVYGDDRDMADQALNTSRFFRAETCGKCVPCRLGSQRLEEIGHRLAGPGRDDLEGFRRDRATIERLASAMKDGSICGLGQSAFNPMLTAVRSFSEDFLPTRHRQWVAACSPARPDAPLPSPGLPSLEAARMPEDDLFSRDLQGHLVRMDDPTRRMLEEEVSVIVDGKELRITRAVHATDPHGELLYDERGKPVPRRTTLYDAVQRRYGEQANPVGVLCYQEHMTSAAVCRVCLVRVRKPEEGRPGQEPQYDDKLVPSCYYPVEIAVQDQAAGAPLVQIDTPASPDRKAAARLDSVTRTLVDLLASDHLHAGASREYDFSRLVERLGLAEERSFGRQGRFEPPARPPADAAPQRPDAGAALDASSPWFVVDRTACILCDRCIRGCGEVRGHYVLARAGKGAESRIAFDWDSPMGASSCVQCGECFISCPTDAITIRPGVKPSPWIEEARVAGLL